MYAATDSAGCAVLQDLSLIHIYAEVEERKVHACGKHEENEDPVDKMRLIIRDARIPDGKAAGRDRRQRRGDRIEQREARNAQQQRLRHGERDVDAVQDARRLTRAGAELCACLLYTSRCV